MYRLESISQWTRYTVGTYTTIAEVQRDCEKRYGVVHVRFTPDDDGVLTAVIYSEEYVTLKLHEVETV